MAIYAIDIGTCSCKLCRFDNDVCEMLPVTDGMTSYWGDNKLLISAAYLDGDNNDELSVGEDAYNKGMLHPAWYYGEFKRRFAQTTPLLFTNTSQVTVDDIYIQTLRQMEAVIQQRGDNAELLVLTYPAAYTKTNDLIQRLVNDAHSAGFFDVETIDEPSAAAACYNHQYQNVAKGENVLIYDFGGGTFDAALIRMGDGGFQHLSASLGLADCGGADIDALIQDDIMNKIAPALGNNAQAVFASSTFQKVMEKVAMQVKHRLSGSNTVTEPIMVSFAQTIPYTLTREDLNKMISPLISRTVDLCRKITMDAGLKPRDIHRVVLVGGSSQIPLIRDRLGEVFTSANIGSSSHPEYMVCMGAALSANLSPVERKLRLAENGDTEAQLWLACRYLAGDEEELGRDIQAGLQWAKKSAEQNNADAQCVLGAIYYYGLEDVVAEDEDIAFSWLIKAAEQNHPDAQDLLGDYFMTHDEVEKALYWYQKGAKSGNVDSMCSLGRIDLEQDSFASAFVWFSKAAELNDSIAQFYLGMLYESNLGGAAADQNTAFEWYMKSANQGYAPAQCEVAKRYYYGREPVEEDNAQGFAWALKAAEQGNTEAQFIVGECYEKGFGTETDISTSVKWYFQSAEGGDSDAQTHIAKWYYFGTGPLPEDNDKAFYWASMAAKKDQPSIWPILAECYEKGFGTVANNKDAYFWYKKAAEAGDASSQLKVGTWLLDGAPSVSKNERAGFKWVAKAAEQGLAMAQFTLGLCYDQGKGKNKNPEKAFSWYMKAAKQGLAVAERFVGIDYADGDGVQKNLAKAEEWLKKAISHGDEESIQILQKVTQLTSLPMPMVIFRRDKRFVGSGRSYPVLIDHKQRGELKNGTSFSVTLSPGNHRVEVAVGSAFGLSSTTKSWFDSNIDFNLGDILVVDATEDAEKIFWQQIAGEEQ